MAFNLLSGKIEPGDWSCGAVDEVDSSRAKPDSTKTAIVGFAAGAGLGCLYLYWRGIPGSNRHHEPLPENR
jgi:hypothetical protein